VSLKKSIKLGYLRFMLKKSPVALATFALMMAIGISPKFLTNSPILKIRPANAQSAPNTQGTVVRIDGSTAAQTVNQVFQQRFQAENPGAKVELNYQGTEEAIKAVKAGKVDLVTIGRPLTDEEKAAGLVEESLGRYKIAVIVSEKNPFANSLTNEQFAKIFRGEITNWSEVGGPNKPINFIDRPAFSDTRQAFSTYPVFQSGNFDSGNNAVPVATDETKAVVENLGDAGIGYAIADQVINLPGIRVLALHQVLPTDKRYSFSAPLYYVYKKDSPSPASKSFLGYVNTPPNQQVITQLRENIVIPAPLPPSSISSANTTPSATATASPGTTTTTTPGANATASPGTTTTTTPGATATASPGANATASPGTTTPGVNATASPNANATVDPNNPNATATASPGATASVDPNATATASPNASVTVDPNNPNATATASPGATASVDPNNPNATATASPGVNATASPNATGTLVPNATATASPGINATISPGLTDGTTATVSPGASGTIAPNTTGTTLQQGTASTTTTSETSKGGLPWWLWLLGIPLLGGLLWFLLNGEEEDAILAAGAADKKSNRIILTPRDCKNAYAYWEVSPEKLKQARHNDNDQLALRIHDVTNIDIDRQEPHSIKQYDCTEAGQQDMHVPISQDNRDYLAELGYVDNDGKWYPVVRSAPVRVPACNPDVNTTTAAVTTLPTTTIQTDTVTSPSVTSTEVTQTDTINKTVNTSVATTEESAKAGLNLAGIAGAAAATVAGVATVGSLTNRADATPVRPNSPSRLVLVPRNADDLYAYWELNNAEQNQAKAAGGEKLTLRLSDVTGLDPATDQVNSVKEYDCSELEQDLHIAVPTESRQYKADLGYLTKTGGWLPLASSSIVDSQIISEKADAIKEASVVTAPNITAPNITAPNITTPNINVTSTTTTISETTDPVSKPESFADKLKGKVGDLIGKGENITEKVSETVKGKFADLVVEGGELKEKIQDRLQPTESSESLSDRLKEKVTDVGASSKNVVTGLGAGLAAVAGGAIASTIGNKEKSETTTVSKVTESRVILVPRYFRDAYAYWELQDNQINQAKQNGGQQLVLRICNVTENPINQSEEKIIEFPCSELSQDLHLTVPDSADYLAEIGYKTIDGMWISLAKSEVVHIPVSSAR
jgi:phosphate transport system substrate-binding protein